MGQGRLVLAECTHSKNPLLIDSGMGVLLEERTGEARGLSVGAPKKRSIQVVPNDKRRTVVEVDRSLLASGRLTPYNPRPQH